jgi:hypothetical protein
MLITLIPLPAPAEKPLGVEEFTSVEELAVSISSYFPKVQGEVKGVQGDRLTLALSKKDGLMPGMVLTLWRDGKDILHPVTGAVIGRAEEEVGTAEVTSVADDSSTAVVKKKLKDPKPGDKARITPRKINIALLPLRAEHPEVIQRLAERLNEFGRFSVLGNEKVAVFIKDRKQRDSALVREMGTAFGLDAVISLGIYPSSDGKQMVTARIFYTEDASQLDTIVAMLDLKSGKQALGEIRPFFVPIKEEKSITPELPFIARYFVTGDFDGKGTLEYAFLDASRIHIYRLEPTGWRRSGRIPRPPRIHYRRSAVAIQYINLDAADMDGDGRGGTIHNIHAGWEGLLSGEVPGRYLPPHRRCPRFSPYNQLSWPRRDTDRTGLRSCQVLCRKAETVYLVRREIRCRSGVVASERPDPVRVYVCRFRRAEPAPCCF